MDSNASNHRRNHTMPHPIPLQDLSRPPESEPSLLEPPNHRRTFSDRGRKLFSRAESRRSGGNRGGSYTPIEAPSESAKPGRPSLSWASTVLSARATQSSDDDQQIGELSPLADGSRLQEALTFAGLSFDRDSDDRSTLLSGTHRRRTLLGRHDSDYSLPEFEPSETRNDSPPMDSDTEPLTGSSRLQPISGFPPSTPSRNSNDRSGAHHTVTGLFPSTTPSSRLGDDLVAAEAGIRLAGDGRSRSGSGSGTHSLSTSSVATPIHRAGTIVRKMSQRVVNLSNEPEVVERDIETEVHRRRSQSRSNVDSNQPHRGSDATEYSHDGPHSPVEKISPHAFVTEEAANFYWIRDGNPFRGNAVGIFSPDSRVRTKLCDILVHPATEPIILLLILVQTVLLAVESAPNVFNNPRADIWGLSWIDYALLGLFIMYTVEIIARIIVSGFLLNPLEYSTINRQIGFRRAVLEQSRSLFALHKQDDLLQKPHDQLHPSILRTLTGKPTPTGLSSDDRHKQRLRLAHRAFLRHSFNRLDFLAVISYWISFSLAVSRLESNHHMYVFRMMSCLRILRLLSLTSGTTIILRSLKKAAPLLLNVALLIGFFWLLFAIIGTQVFKSSLRRTCVWIDPAEAQSNFTSNLPGNFQFCGGYLTPDGIEMPWLFADGSSSGERKGYLCPPDSLCVSTENPYNGTVSFDNIAQAIELVFVIMTSNTLTDLMYYLTDSDYLIAALFFAFGTMVMTFWLINLLIAVITSSFAVIREESKSSAFAAKPSAEPLQVEEVSQSRKPHPFVRLYNKTFWFWIAIIVYDLLLQSLRSASMSAFREHLINTSETVVTFILLLEIVFRLAAYRSDFFRDTRNCVDLTLAVITAVMQIPAIRSSGQPYAWMTFFQIVRIYRVVLAIPLTRDLILLVLGNVYGLLNLILFVFLLTFLVAIFASQLFRGELPQQDSNGNTLHITFATIYNSFLGMYQLLSSENWTILLYNVTTYDSAYRTGWIGAIFLILWFILSYFVVLNMFIAVIQENFDVSEDEKRLQQVKAFLQRRDIGGSSHGTLSLAAIFKFRQITGRRQDPLDYGPAMMEMLLKDAVVKDFLDDNIDTSISAGASTPLTTPHQYAQPNFSSVGIGASETLRQRLISWAKHSEPNPFYSHVKFSRAYEDLDARTMAKEVVSAAEQRKRAQRDYLIRHPRYNVSLYIFKPSNHVRRLCQKIVGPGRGTERFEGVAPNPPMWYAFSAFLYAAIVSMVVLACVTTPLYQKQYFAEHSFSVRNWFVFTDMAFAVIFTVEAVVRVIADGMFWTPNAYYRSAWGLVDGLVLVALWINVAASLWNQGAVSRAVGAFQALRALRLLNISDSARDTFHSIIIRGGWKILSAAFVSLSLLIPFAIYGLNLFNGQMQQCNDSNSNITGLADCVNEYMSSPSNWNVLAPRQISNPYYDFDTFGGSLFILFQIVSQEGWTDVLWTAESITGVFTQPQPYATQGNAAFFVVFNLLATVFVLTLFVSVFMRNYTEQTGVAFLTTEQRSWLELRKLLRQISPSKRPPSNVKRESWQQWCYRRAVRKTGRWQRFVTCVFVFHLILLCLELYPEPSWWQLTREYTFLALTCFYIANVVIRIIGLTWTRFRKSSWDLYSLVAVLGAFVTIILYLSNIQTKVFTRIHKLFLVSILLLLIPRNNQLDQLFKTAAASLTAIANLLATWFVLFLVFAIAMTQTFGITRFGSNEFDNLNFRSVPKALILLYRLSMGEGWNAIMEDYASIVPPFCTVGESFLDGDCGSPEWARALFISWNILSMYIFVNMFISLIYESFSYVYQRSSGLSMVTRNEIRKFKQAWAEFDPNGTGYIRKEVFPRLLGELSGVFEMRIYDGDFTVGRIKEDCKIDRRTSQLPINDGRRSDDIDLDKLNKRLARLPVEEIRQRRTRMNVFYEEVMVSADPDRGIAFTSLLMILAHYKVINDNKSLRLEEFLRRRARLQRVEEAVRRSIVISFFDTLYWSRRFKRAMEVRRSGRMAAVPQLQVPEIFVDDEDDRAAERSGNRGSQGRPALSLQIPTFDITEAPHTSGSDARSAISSSHHLRNRSDSAQNSPTRQTSPTRTSLSSRPSVGDRLPTWEPRSDFRLSASHGGASPGQGERTKGSSERTPERAGRNRAGSRVSTQDVLEVLDNSAWGESLRRTSTLRRQGSKS